MVEGAPRTIPDRDLKHGIPYLIHEQRADGAFPDDVRRNGVPDYFSAGTEPETDSAQFLVKLVFDYYRRTGKVGLFRTYRRALVRGMNWIPRRGGLVWIDPANPHSSYGFTDGIRKTGNELFSSLLYIEASHKLASLYRAIHMQKTGRRWERTSRHVRRKLQRLWSPRDGLFLAASIDNRQTDVWGSAYAAFAGIATPRQAHRIVRWLRRNYEGIVQRGQVRETAPGTYWQRTFGSPPGAFQNGAY
jgi:hypothetical protein